jgi:hypothetical protein
MDVLTALALKAFGTRPVWERQVEHDRGKSYA